MYPWSCQYLLISSLSATFSTISAFQPCSSSIFCLLFSPSYFVLLRPPPCSSSHSILFRFAPFTSSSLFSSSSLNFPLLSSTSYSFCSSTSFLHFTSFHPRLAHISPPSFAPSPRFIVWSPRR